MALSNTCLNIDHINGQHFPRSPGPGSFKMTLGLCLRITVSACGHVCEPFQLLVWWVIEERETERKWAREREMHSTLYCSFKMGHHKPAVCGYGGGTLTLSNVLQKSAQGSASPQAFRTRAQTPVGLCICPDGQHVLKGSMDTPLTHCYLIEQFNSVV